MSSQRTIKEIPRNALIFQETGAAVAVEAQDEAGTERRFRMNANTGKVIEDHWWWGNLVIDLTGIEIGRQDKPALRDHHSSQIVGHTDTIEATDDGLMAEGLLSRATAHGQEVIALLDEGFPWQASVYVPPTEIEMIPEDAYTEVNGQRIDGPLTVFRKSRLKEVSFTALGADDDTSAEALTDRTPTVKLDVLESKPGGEVMKPKYPTLSKRLGSALDQRVTTSRRKRGTIVAALAADSDESVERVEEILAGTGDAPSQATLSAFAGTLKVTEADLIAHAEKDGVTFSAPDPEAEEPEAELTASQFSEQRPELAQEIRDAAVLAERKRIQGIHDAKFAGADMDALAAQFIADGTPVGTAQQRFIEAEKARKGTRLDQLAEAAPTSTGGGEGTVNGESQLTASQLTGERLYQHEWEQAGFDGKTPKDLQSEFYDFAGFAAWRKRQEAETEVAAV